MCGFLKKRDISGRGYYREAHTLRPWTSDLLKKRYSSLPSVHVVYITVPGKECIRQVASDACRWRRCIGTTGPVSGEGAWAPG